MEIIRRGFHTDLRLIKEFIDTSLTLLKAYGISEDNLFKIRLILDELISNSYKHGNNKDFSKIIEVSIEIDDNYCMIRVRDEGKGINFDRKKDVFSEHGRGLHIVDFISDRMSVDNNIITAFVSLKSNL